jgi:hypothetical protein
MIKVSHNTERFEIISPMPWGKRLLFGLLALFPLLAPSELMVRVQWTGYLNPFFFIAAFISAGAIALSLFLAFAGLAGLSSRMTIDAAHSTFTYSHVAPVVRQRTQVFPLSSLESIHVETHDWSDGAPSYSLMIKMSGGATFSSGSSWSRQDIEHHKAQAEAFLDRAHPTQKPN